MDASLWTAREEYMGVEWRERGEKRKKKEYVAARACGARLGSARLDSTRLGSARLARLEIFKALFGYPLSGGGGKGRGVSVFASPC